MRRISRRFARRPAWADQDRPEELALLVATEPEDDASVPAGQPNKIDIDTMHAYRDASRTLDGERIVSYAAIPYPGPRCASAGD